MRATLNQFNLSQLQVFCSNQLAQTFKNYLDVVPCGQLKAAMTHLLSNGGKHLRPLLVYATGSIFGAPLENLLVAACAIELMHSYSLIHDDLPSMDNAELRRNSPTCHRVYGEATAILAGDAMQTLAMQVLATHPADLDISKRINMIEMITKACGPFGMVAGQSLEINNNEHSLATLETIYQLKTGALLTAAIECGRLCSHDEDALNQQKLQEYANCLGFAYQIQDDILDIESPTHLLGKNQHTDQKNNKATYPELFGLEKSKHQMHLLYQQATQALTHFGTHAQLLQEITQLISNRNK